MFSFLLSWTGSGDVSVFRRRDVIMSSMASQITSLTIVYSAVYLGADQRKHQSSASLAFVRGIHRGPVNTPHRWPVTRKMFPCDDVIMATRLRRRQCNAYRSLACMCLPCVWPTGQTDGQWRQGFHGNSSSRQTILLHQRRKLIANADTRLLFFQNIFCAKMGSNGYMFNIILRWRWCDRHVHRQLNTLEASYTCTCGTSSAIDIRWNDIAWEETVPPLSVILAQQDPCLWT